MRLLLGALIGACLVAAAPRLAEARSTGNVEGTVSGGMLFGGPVWIEGIDDDIDIEAGPMIRASVDMCQGNAAFGAYVMMIFTEASYHTYTGDADMLEFGVSIAQRIEMDSGMIVKAGIEVGSRSNTLSSYGQSMDSTGLAVNLNVEFRVPIPGGKNFGLVEFGFIAQPTGKDDDDNEVSFAPMFYLTGGIAF